MPTSRGMGSPEATGRKNRLPVLIGLALTILTVITFWPLKDCGFIGLDDNLYVYENADVQSGLNWKSTGKAFSSELVEKSRNWHPVTWLSLMLDYQLFGLNPRGYHLMNLLFHVVSTVLLFLILSRMTKTLWQSAFVAALFAIHPLHVESVAWIAERKDVLSTLFWLLTMGAYSDYVEHPGWRRYLLVLLFFALGMMAKPILVTLPFVLLLLDFWPLERFQKITPDHKIQTEANRSVNADKQGKKSKKKHSVGEVIRPADPASAWSSVYPLVWEKVPLFALALLSSIVTFIAQHEGGAVQSIEAFPPGVRIANAFVSYISYLGKMLWPGNLAVFYPHPGSWPPWQVIGSAVLLAFITLAVIRMARRFPYLATGWLWYAGTLVPVIGIVQVGSQAMADRYTYIPLTGLFIMAAWGVPGLFGQWRYRRQVLFASSALIILILSVVTGKQVGYWQDSITLFNHALKVTDHNWLAYNNLGAAYNELGNHRQAIEDYGRAIEIKPGYAEAYNNRGSAYYPLGDYRRAIEDYDRAIELKPGYADAHANRGAAHYRLGDYRQAIEDYSRAIEIKPGAADTYAYRGIAHNDLGNYRQAIEDHGRAIEIDPRFAEAYYNRGVAHSSLGNYRQAIEDYSRAIEIKPGYADAYNNRGAAYYLLGNYPRAIEDYGRAVEIKPGYAEAYANRGITYGRLGNNNLAVTDLRTAAKLGDDRARNLLQRQGITW